MLIVPALVTVVVLAATGRSTFTSDGAGHVLLLIGTGVLTVGPLLAFATAARALPLSVLGLLQYLTPTGQFLLGVFWAHEHMAGTRWVGFVLVWAALVALSADALRRRRPGPAQTSDQPVSSMNSASRPQTAPGASSAA